MGKKISRHLFQVVSVCSLFFASKLFEKRHIGMSALMNYTQSKFDRAELLSLEKELVTSLASFSYPPIASTFCLPCTAWLNVAPGVRRIPEGREDGGGL